MKRSTAPVAILVGALVFGACSEVDGDPVTPSVEAPLEQRAPKKGDDPIAAVAVDRGFTQLVGALGYVDAELGTGLVSLFSETSDQYTVFAPTDAAFEDLYALLTVVLGTPVDEIGDLPPEIVLDVLLYHVTDGRRAANSVLPRKNVRTITSLLGETFAVRPDGTIEDGLTGLRSDAAIVAANVPASNGIVHAIDGVIVPPSVVQALTE
ncbi:MAG: fasciclin domain-containing protein [Gemmatimonadota bacterium]|jgi:uncharacterized surface protein with fasciclin (FAS1) repeats